MRARCSALAVAASAAASVASTQPVPGPPYYPVVADKQLDCAVRLAAYNFSLAIQPERGPGLDVFDALSLTDYCGLPRPQDTTGRRSSFRHGHLVRPRSAAVPASTPSFFADAAGGDDSNPGTEQQPFATVQRGVEACRSSSSSAAGCAVVLRDAAPFVLRAPLALTAGLDDGLTLTAYPGESPVLTGAWPLEGTWEPVDVTAPNNVWVMRGAGKALVLGAPQALVPPPAATDRFFRARYPNGDLELDLIPDGYTNASAWFPPSPPPSPPVPVPVDTPNRPWDFFFPNFTWARGGTAIGNFEPPEGYWIHAQPPGGVPWAVPSGFSYSPASFSPRAAQWGNVSGTAVVRAFHGEYWGSWLLEVASHNPSTGSVLFARGGWQEARGWQTGGALYVENVFAELDAPGEWYLDEATGDLYLFANGTAGTQPIDGLAAAQLETLITVSGFSPSSPSVGVQLVGLTLTGTAPTYLTRPFRAPSGGDWSFADTAAVIAEGTVGFTVDGCLLDRLGGNGILLRGWNVNATVTASTFTRLGDSGIVSAGLLSPALSDLSGALAPVGTLIDGCRFQKLGLHVKQSGAYYAAISANATIRNSVAFNLPRAAVNINDVAFGGHILSRNLFFGCVQETADHSCYNTWARDAFVQPDGSFYPVPIRAEGNFILGGFYAIHGLDHDDGSFHTVDTGNVVAFTGVKNFEGFNKQSLSNLFVRPDFLANATTPLLRPDFSVDGTTPALPVSNYRPGALRANPVTPSGVPLPVAYYFPACARSVGQHTWGPALADVYANNTCVLAQPSPFLFGECTPSAPAADGLVPLTSNNTYLTPGANLSIACGSKRLSLAEAQAVGYELGSVVQDGSGMGPAEVAELIRAWLNF